MKQYKTQPITAVEHFISNKKYKIMREYCGGKLKRYNTKVYASYEEARKAIRRIVTKLYGYKDSYTQYGFRVASE